MTTTTTTHSKAETSLPVNALKGIFGAGTATKPVSVEQMNAAIAARVATAQNAAT